MVAGEVIPFCSAWTLVYSKLPSQLLQLRSPSQGLRQSTSEHRCSEKHRRLYLQCPFVSMSCLLPGSDMHETFSTPVTSPSCERGVFSSEKLGAPERLAASRIACDAKLHFYLSQHKDSEPEECCRIPARCPIWERSAGSRVT